RNASYAECRRLRIVQTIDTIRASRGQQIESLSADTSYADSQAHHSLAFDKLQEIGPGEISDYVQLTNGYAFQPWLRPVERGIKVSEQVDWRSRLAQLGEIVSRLSNGLTFEVTKTY